MDRKQLTQILVHLLLVFYVVVKTTDSVSDLENVAGKLVFYQTEGNTTYVRNTGELAADVPTETVFELVDPQKNLSSAGFTYTWDLGNGEVIEGADPVVRYQYSKPGNYTLQLKVGANEPKYTSPVTGVYSLDVQVLDAIKNIQLKGPAEYRMSHNTSLTLDVDGSPPMWACWHILTHCDPDTTMGCTLTMMYGKTLHVNHTFTTTGAHCLDISVSNNVSKLRTSFSLNVGRNRTPLFFVLSCAAILVATLAFIMVVGCRTRRQNKSQVPASSNAMFLKDSGGHTQNRLNLSTVEKGEKEPLILQHKAK
ncbi:transmembrane protein 130 [Nothobranchius furzeri]|uniref:Transmembrane protein 130 n=1 Tax=Nothobranchius furzeri TaxID=105023 RepID=A0A1A8AH44_NOTFU|nr:transmembrane protein 130 [Nothobranchius furzeri]KAF7204726.1 transmembrane protein 130-like [Nothobranchius furzeri]